MVTSVAVPFSGGTAESAQEITLTGTAGDFVIFTDNSVSASGDRFSGQVVGNVDSGGTFKFKLKYEDTPGTTVNNTTYNGLVQIGTAHFSFTVVQSNLTALTQASGPSIAGTLGVGSVLTCTQALQLAALEPLLMLLSGKDLSLVLTDFLTLAELRATHIHNKTQTQVILCVQ